MDHPEYVGKVSAYKDFGTGFGGDDGSYHAPAVLSLLAGETCGVAPGARVWFAAVPSWEMDAQYYADALYWIIAENALLPEGEKIRVVSVSSSPSMWSETTGFKNGDAWVAAVDAAHDAGMLVLDCRDSENSRDTGLCAPGFFSPSNRDDFSQCYAGLPDDAFHSTAYYENNADRMFVPIHYRTMAECYYPGQTIYRYDSVGGLSWAIPYAAGVFALGFQLRPELSWQTMQQIMMDSRHPVSHDDGTFYMIDPPAFVAAVQAYAAD
jgi:hypothetical protein